MQLYYWNNKIWQEAFSNVTKMSSRRVPKYQSLQVCLLVRVTSSLRLHTGSKKLARKSLVWRRWIIEVVPEWCLNFIPWNKMFEAYAELRSGDSTTLRRGELLLEAAWGAAFQGKRRTSVREGREQITESGWPCWDEGACWTNWYAGKWLRTGAADGLLGSQTQKAEYRWVEAEQRRDEFRESLWEQSRNHLRWASGNSRNSSFDLQSKNRLKKKLGHKPR